MGGTITASRELLTLQSEVGQLRASLGELEDRELALMAQIEDLDAEERGLRQRQQALTAAVEAADARRRESRPGLEHRIAELEEERAGAVGRLEPSLLALYDRVAARRPGQAVAVMRGGECSGCHVALPPGLQQQVRTSERPVTCQSCERILVVE